MQREAEARFARLKTGAQGPDVKSTASDQSDCPHLFYFISRDYSFFYVKQKAETLGERRSHQGVSCADGTLVDKNMERFTNLRVILAQGPC